MPDWIFGEFHRQFEIYSRFEILLNDQHTPCHLLHFLPYYEVPPEVPMLSTAYFTHQELEHENSKLTQAFIDAGHVVTAAICQAKKYCEVLQANDVSDVTQIIPGVDLERFALRPAQSKAREKLIVGFVGQLYDTTPRKNPQLLQRIAELPFVELRATLGKLSAEKLPAFYADLDLIVSPSTIEGGPMALTEGLAVGVPSIAFQGVGVADEFSTGIIRVPFGDDDAFLRRLEVFWKEERQLYCDPDMMRTMRAQVEALTWESFVRKHDEVWMRLLNQG